MSDEELERLANLILKSHEGFGGLSKDDKEYIEKVSIENTEYFRKASERALKNRKRIDNAKSEFTNNSLYNEAKTIIARGFAELQITRENETKTLNTIREINSESSFQIEVTGDSMVEAGILSGDIVFAKSNVVLKDEDIVIVSIEGKLFIKKLRILNGEVWLFSENKNYLPFKECEDLEIKYLGKVFAVLRSI